MWIILIVVILVIIAAIISKFTYSNVFMMDICLVTGVLYYRDISDKPRWPVITEILSTSFSFS